MYDLNFYPSVGEIYKRDKCIFCHVKLSETYFKTDYKCQVAHYAIDLDDTSINYEIPFNIYICPNCNTVQTKYLGCLNEIYKINHADGTGITMTNLHKKTCELVFKYSSNIKNIIEIGSSYGLLADNIINIYNCNNIKLEYNIIEPNFKGDRKNKIIVDDFYENINDANINANTIIISHVFEHFYEPNLILKKISNNENIKYFILVFPDLEYYLKNNILHVLNTEHTYYINNNFLINIICNNGFKLIERENYLNHSVILIFERKMPSNCHPDGCLPYTSNFPDSLCDVQSGLITKNSIESLDNYFNNIHKEISFINNIINKNPQKKIYLWPASIHTLYLCIFGLNMSFTGFLDNSKNKIGKKVYGYNKPIYDFKEIVKLNDNNTIILLNGGLFNYEIKSIIKNSSNIKFHCLG
jgi:hypothetical protein